MLSRLPSDTTGLRHEMVLSRGSAGCAGTTLRTPKKCRLRIRVVRYRLRGPPSRADWRSLVGVMLLRGRHELSQLCGPAEKHESALAMVSCCGSPTSGC